MYSYLILYILIILIVTFIIYYRIISNETSNKPLSIQTAYPLNLPIVGPLFTDLIADSKIYLNFEWKGYIPDQLVPTLEMEEAIRNGVLDAAFTGLSYSIQQDPVLELYTTVPFGLNADAYITYIFENGGIERLNHIASRGNLYYYPMALLPPETGGWYLNEINTVDDFQSVKMRIYGLGRNIIEGLGGQAVIIGATNIINAVNEGLINAAEFSSMAIDEALGLPTVFNYWYSPSWNQLSTVLYFVIRLDLWESLSEFNREGIKYILRANLYSRFFEANRREIDIAEKYGHMQRRFSDDILEAMENVWIQFLNRPNNTEMKMEYERMKEFQIQYYAYQRLMAI